jgi:hypothetical protein
MARPVLGEGRWICHRHQGGEEAHEGEMGAEDEQPDGSKS